MDNRGTRRRETSRLVSELGVIDFLFLWTQSCEVYHTTVSRMFETCRGLKNQELQAINDATNHLEQRRRRGTCVSAKQSNCVAPSGALHHFPADPGLAPGATFLTRLAALGH